MRRWQGRRYIQSVCSKESWDMCHRKQFYHWPRSRKFGSIQLVQSTGVYPAKLIKFRWISMFLWLLVVSSTWKMETTKFFICFQLVVGSKDTITAWQTLIDFSMCTNKSICFSCKNNGFIENFRENPTLFPFSQKSSIFFVDFFESIESVNVYYALFYILLAKKNRKMSYGNLISSEQSEFFLLLSAKTLLGHNVGEFHWKFQHFHSNTFTQFTMSSVCSTQA